MCQNDQLQIPSAYVTVFWTLMVPSGRVPYCARWHVIPSGLRFWTYVYQSPRYCNGHMSCKAYDLRRQLRYITNSGSKSGLLAPVTGHSPIVMDAAHKEESAMRTTRVFMLNLWIDWGWGKTDCIGFGMLGKWSRFSRFIMVTRDKVYCEHSISSSLVYLNVRRHIKHTPICVCPSNALLCSIWNLDTCPFLLS